MKAFAKVLLVSGIMMIALSFMLRMVNQPGSPEAILSALNIGLGVLMVLLAAAYLAYQRKKHTAQTGQPSSIQAKGEQDRKEINAPN